MGFIVPRNRIGRWYDRSPRLQHESGNRESESSDFLSMYDAARTRALPSQRVQIILAAIQIIVSLY